MVFYSCVVLLRNHKLESYDELVTQLSVLSLKPLFLSGKDVDGWYSRTDLQLNKIKLIVTDDTPMNFKLYQEKCPSAAYAWLHEQVKDFDPKLVKFFSDEMDLLQLLSMTASIGTKDSFMRNVLNGPAETYKPPVQEILPHEIQEMLPHEIHEMAGKNVNLNQALINNNQIQGQDHKQHTTKQSAEDELMVQQSTSVSNNLSNQQPQKQKPKDAVQIPAEQQGNTEETTIEEDLTERTRLLQREVLNRHKWQKNKTIAIWSPIPRTGVSTFTFQFALALGQKRIQVVALEGITERYIMKEMLERYSTQPKTWTSYAQSVLGVATEGGFEWIYKDVQFLPLDRKNHEAEWTRGRIQAYVKGTNIVDVTLLDLPTGKMEPHTLEMLAHVDEVWVLGNDSIYEFNGWTEYIQRLQKNGKPFFFIHNECYSFSNPQEIAKLLKLPLLTTLPAMRDIWMQSYYKDQPLILDSKRNSLLLSPFEELTGHIFAEFEAGPLRGRKLSRQSFWPLLRKTLKRFT